MFWNPTAPKDASSQEDRATRQRDINAIMKIVEENFGSRERAVLAAEEHLKVRTAALREMENLMFGALSDAGHPRLAEELKRKLRSL